MIDENRLKRLHFRAWHRGTKEADLLIGGFLDTYGRGWSAAQGRLVRGPWSRKTMSTSWPGPSAPHSRLRVMKAT